MRLSDVAIVILLAVATVFLWAAGNRPVTVVDWAGPLEGVSFSPYRRGQDPADGIHPTALEIDADLARLDGFAQGIRSYTVQDALAALPALAHRRGLAVTAGAWIGPDEAANRAEIARLIRLANGGPAVARVLVGNEAVLRGDLSVAALIDHVETVRAAVAQPVSVSEPWHVWLAHPELADHVDFVAVHVLPYWEGVPVREAVAFVFARIADIRAAFPGKPVVLTEVGWPSNGRIRHAAVPSPVNQALFLRTFLDAAARDGLDYFVVEAFDQPWKTAIEGAAGAYWGLFDADRRLKLRLAGPLVPVEAGPWLAAASVGLTIFPLVWFLRRQRRLAFAGRLFYGALMQATACGAVWTGHVFASQYLSAPAAAVLAVMTGLLGVLILALLAEGFELAESLWRRPVRRQSDLPVLPPGGPAPKVSIHLPICDEPPAMVIETLRALSRLDYPDFEVVVVDNNTVSEARWRPVEAACAALGQRFRFFHVDRLAGFKAGALNFALRHTAPDADIVGVVDSDYVVEPDWLSALVPLFAEPSLAIVQAPQDYRDGDANAFKRACALEYAGFFRIGMVQRNERNAIIQHGTMTLVRRRALAAVGGWGDWCISEDAELGLRLLAGGHGSLYVERCFGRGLTPDSFASFRTQRSRWAYGGVQILKRHVGALLAGRSGGLTLGQRYHFVAGWLPWLADAVNLACVALALGWTAGLLSWPQRFAMPLAVFLMAALAFFSFKVGKTLWLYRARVGVGWPAALAAAVAGLALSHTVAKAVLAGLFTSGRPFVRTPKCERRPVLRRGLAVIWQEAALFGLLAAAAVAVAAKFGRADPEALLWSATLAIQSLPYGAAIAMATVNLLPAGRARRRTRAVALARER